jgi:hypothetical protein
MVKTEATMRNARLRLFIILLKGLLRTRIGELGAGFGITRITNRPPKWRHGKKSQRHST